MSKFSETFCVYPWLHQQVTPKGQVNVCCVASDGFVENDQGEPFILDKVPMSEAWNSQYMKDIREKMLNGEKVRTCETCYKQESIGKTSYRQSTNSEWLHRLGEDQVRQLVEYSESHDFKVDHPPAYLDLRLGNLCNLKCRMCNPSNSIQIYNEWKSIDDKTQGEYSRFWKQRGLSLHDCGPWYESDTFWRSVEENIPYLKKVYMTGGEPTLIAGNQKFLNKCKEMGFADKIELFFNINATHLTDEFLESLRPFNYTQINCSLDGFDKVNEYMRPPSRWKICDQNLRRLALETDSNVGLGVTPVIQIYNILNIVDLLFYVEELINESGKDILIDFLFCFKPVFLDIIHVPENVRDLAIERLEKFKSQSKVYNSNMEKSHFLKNGVDSMIRRLGDSKEDPQMMADFLSYTKTLDLQRNQSFDASFPELAKALSDKGYEMENSPTIGAEGEEVVFRTQSDGFLVCK